MIAELNDPVDASREENKFSDTRCSVAALVGKKKVEDRIDNPAPLCRCRFACTQTK